MTTWTTWYGTSDHPNIPPKTPVAVLYRGLENPAKGIRLPFGPASRFDWSHDGVPDDIVAYRISKPFISQK